MLNFLRKFKKYIIAGAVALSVVGVGYFYVYPTYLAKTGTLSPDQCSTVALIVAAYVSKDNEFLKDYPEETKKQLLNADVLSKRIAKYIVEKNPALVGAEPNMIYSFLTSMCLNANGKFDLTK